MRSEGPLWRIDPAIWPCALMRLVQRIADAIFILRSLTDHQQLNLFFRIVQEGMADAGTGGESYAVTTLKLMQHSIDPGIWAAFDHEDEFLFGAFSMRIARASAGQQANMMNANPRQSELLAQRRIEAHEFVIGAILVSLRVFEQSPVGDEVWS